MIWHIARKDFLSNIISARFIIGFVLCLFLIPFSVLINIDDYKEHVRLYHMYRDSAESAFKSVRVYSKLRPEVVKPPETLSIFSKGISENVGSRVKIWLGDKPMLAEGRARVRDNPMLNAFFSIDFAGIIGIIMSLLALIFSYDICTREKEDGTLRLQLSNSLSRAKLLTGKVLGVFLTLLPILAFCFILSALIILVSSGISLTGKDWSRIVLLFIASLIYVAVFVFIGLFISTRFKSSVSSIVVCLFFWVFFVFIVPNLSVYLADKFIRVESRDNLNMVINDLNKEFDRKVLEYQKSLKEPDWWMQGSSWSEEDGGEEKYSCTRSFFERARLSSIYSEPLRIQYADKKWAHQRAYLDSLDYQRKVSDRISLISPAAVFRLVSSAICYTNVEAHENFMERTRQYREEFVRYLQNKDLFASFSYFTRQPPQSFLTADQIVERKTGGEFKTLKALEEWSRKQPSWRDLFKKLGKVTIPGTSPEDYSPLDVSDVPVFNWQQKHLLTGLQSYAIHLSALLVESLLLFYLSFVGFIRYDVR